MAERPWAEFGCALHPADNPSGCQLAGDPRDHGRVVRERLDRLSVLRCDACQLLAIDGWSPEWMVRDIPIRIAEIDAVGVQRGAKRTAPIARRRRHEQALEARFGQDPCI